MKRKFLMAIVMLLLAVALACGAHAETASGTCGDNLTWVLDGGVLTLSGSGPMYDFDYNADGTAVDNPWQEYVKSITHVVLPKGITYIGNYSFHSTQITEIDIPEGVTGIGIDAFSYTKLQSLKLPSTVKRIEEWSFACNEELKSVTLNDGLEYIGAAALMQSPITSIEIPGSVKLIDGYEDENWGVVYGAFSMCENLTSVKLNNGIETIGPYAFEACGFSSIEIPPSVKTLGDGAFLSCENLTSIILNEGLEVIDSGAFNLSGLKSVVIPDSVKRIENWAFADLESLTSVKLGSGLEYMGLEAFAYTGITSVTIPGSLEMIGDSAFLGCEKLTNVVIEEGVKIVAWGAFGDTSFVDITIPSTMTYMGDFSLGSDNLGRVTVYSRDVEYTECTLDCSPAVGESINGIMEQNIVLVGYVGSTTEAYAKQYGYRFEAIGGIMVESIELDITETALNVGESVKVNATVLPENADNKEVSWSSSNTKVATVDGAGNIKAVAGGNATITVSAKDGSGVTATVKVTVRTNEKKVTSIKLSPASSELKVGQTVSVSAAIQPTDATNKGLTWSSSNTKVASVDKNGKVTAVGAGSATIIAKAKDGSGVSGSMTVKVLPVEKKITSIKLDPVTVQIKKKKSVQVNAVIEPADATNKALEWSSSDTKIATVDANGKVTGVANGSVTITARAKDGSGVAGTMMVYVVKKPVTEVKLNKKKVTIELGDTYKLSTTVSPSGADNKKITWTSSDESVAKVNSKGKVTSVSTGQCTITATTTSGHKATCKVTVITKRVTSVKLNKTKATITLKAGEKFGKSITLKATITPDGATNPRINWVSNKASVATVDENGVVTSVGFGKCKIYAISEDNLNAKAFCTVIVEPKPVEKVKISGKGSMRVGKKQTLTATVTPKKAYDRSVTWVSSNNKIATVDANGVVTAHKKGTVTITCKANDGSFVTAKFVIKVKKAK